MDEILENVKSLDTEQLRKKLLEIGLNVGPIPPTTIGLFQRRLAKALFEANTGYVSNTLETDNNKNVSTESVKEEPKLNTSSDVFFAVSLPENVDPQVSVEVSQLVFSDKDLALKTAKRVKGSRFKVFKTLQEAEEFAKLRAEHTFSSPMKAPKAEENKDEMINTESIPYKAPKPQDLVQVRRTIEKGDVRLFLDYVWNNPRYLVSSGDTPVIYQEGFRYSAMHIAAMKNQPEICRVILDTLEDPRFIQQLYCQSLHTEESLNKTINFLVDLYLNMPDKGNCESPLHMACKFGHDEVVRILAAHPKTDKLLKNKYGEMPKDLICSRSYNALTSTITRIAELLQGQYYVPLLRSIDNSTLPVIGQPWSVDVNKSPVGVSSVPGSPMSPRDPVLSIKACAGPMSPSFASDFHKKWTTPPSEGTEKARLYLDTKRGDSEKGMERIGRHLAHEMQVPWIEHWDFLDSYADLSTAEGLDVLEEYFRKSVWHTFIKEFKDRHGIEELFQDDVTEISTPTKAPSCDNINLKNGVNDNCYSNRVEENDEADKSGPVSKNLNELFAAEAQASPIAEQPQNHEVNGESNITKDSETDIGIIKEIVHSSTKEEESLVPSKASCESPVRNSDINQPNSPMTVVSPMTSLSQSFAQLSVHDRSWSDKVNNNANISDAASDYVDAEKSAGDKALTDTDQTDQTASIDEVKLNGVGDVTDANVHVITSKANKSKPNGDTLQSSSNNKTEQAVAVENKTTCSSDAVQNITNTNIDILKDEADLASQQATDPGSTNSAGTVITELASGTKSVEVYDAKSVEAENKINNNVKDTTTVETENKAHFADTEKIITNNVLNKTDSECSTKVVDTGINGETDQSVSPDNKVVTEARTRFLSERSDSSASYKTAEEDFYDGNVMSPFSDPGAPCVKLMYNQSLDRLKEQIDSRYVTEYELQSEPVYLLLIWKKPQLKELMKVDIVLYPTTDSIHELLLFESLEVLSYDDITRVLDGDVIDVSFTYKNEELKLKAHFTRAVRVPKPAYIHGAEPTREDLDVCRALGNTIVSQESHPNVFQWKINLSKYCADRKYRWQSPAKVKTMLRQSSPLASPQRTKSPVIPYGSPISYGCEERKFLVSSDIRTTLFPSIYE